MLMNWSWADIRNLAAVRKPTVTTMPTVTPMALLAYRCHVENLSLVTGDGTRRAASGRSTDGLVGFEIERNYRRKCWQEAIAFQKNTTAIAAAATPLFISTPALRGFFLAEVMA